jgi:glycosyltransferase involved in cell wall biosynthesis
LAAVVAGSASVAEKRMISVVIPTLDAEATIPDTLSALIPASLDGLVREVIVVDAGSKDHTREIADWAGAEVIETGPGRGIQLKAGAAAARQPWILFLIADVVLDHGWEREASHFMERVDKDSSRQAAAAFRFALDDDGAAPRLLEALARLRFAGLRLPYGEQGLLIPRLLYDDVGGHRELAGMEDVDIARRLGRRRMKLLRARAVSSARGYREDGYLRRMLNNLIAFVRYALGVSPVRAPAPQEERTEP